MTDGNVNGGIYLMHLKSTPGLKQGSVSFTWRAIDGTCHKTTVQLAIPPPLPPGPVSDTSCDPGMRKSVALTEYVRLLSKYSTDERFGHHNPFRPAPPRVSSIGSDVRARLQAAGANAIVLMNAPEHGVSDALFLLHHEYARLFTDFLAYLQAEMIACGDSTLATSNQNIVETVTRIIEVEKSEFMSMLTVAASQQPAPSVAQVPHPAPVDSGSSSSDDDDDSRNPSADTPASFICPISHLIFKDPVIAADDNTCVYYCQALHAFALRLKFSSGTSARKSPSGC
jgi:hypothetical protein